MRIEGDNAQRHVLNVGRSVDGELAHISYLRGGSGHPVHRERQPRSQIPRTLRATRLSIQSFCAFDAKPCRRSLRGHGSSLKSRNAMDYALKAFTSDVLKLCDVCWNERTFAVVGYSMGAHVAMSVARALSHRVEALVLCGMGDRIAATVGLAPEFADALDHDDPRTTLPGAGFPSYALRFREHAASSPFNDLRALAACLRGQSCVFDLASLAAVTAATLVMVGDQDKLAGLPYRVAALFPRGIGVMLPGLNHASALADQEFRSRAIKHLDATATSAIEGGLK